mgnify:CR=1 FL=1
MTQLSIAEASRLGVSGLVSSAEAGREIILARHGRVAAEVVSSQEMQQLRHDQELLRDATLVMSGFVTDSGARTDLDSAMSTFRFNRSELESEFEAELQFSDLPGKQT